MAKHRVPQFLAGTATEERDRLMKEYIHWKKYECSKLMVKHLEDRLDQLIKKDEKSTPLSWFEFKWNKAKRLGEREALRKLIDYLKE